MSTPPAVGNASPFSSASDYNALAFQIQLALAKVQTVSLCEVVACTNSGGVSAVGTVDVRVLVNLMTGNRTAVPHGVIYGLPYSRLQGGASAFILDPVAGDIGITLFCSRDISGVTAAKGAANPGSERVFDWADGLYVGGVLNGVPTQYIQFDASGITITSTGTVTINAATAVNVTAPDITLTGAVIVAGTLDQTGGGAGTFSGAINATGDVTGAGTSLHTHTHDVVGVQSGVSTIATTAPL